MTPEERDLIDGLFQRLKGADTPQKDREADGLIAKRVVELPASPYLLVQTVLVQEHALNNAQTRIAQLEAELEAAKKAQAPAAPASGGGTSFLGGLLGRGGPWGAYPEAPQAAVPPAPQAPPQTPGQTYAPPRYAGGSVPVTAPASGGFLHSALSTAAGVAGGALLYDGIRSLFFHNPGPFGPALGMGGGWGMPAGFNEATIVSNYGNADFANNPNDPGAGPGFDPSGPADAGPTDANWAPDTQGDPGSGGGADGFQDASFDGGADMDTGGDFGGGDSDFT
jgi:hypothetical protein